MICQIVRRREYLGETVNFKTSVPEYHAKQIRISQKTGWFSPIRMSRLSVRNFGRQRSASFTLKCQAGLFARKVFFVS